MVKFILNCTEIQNFDDVMSDPHVSMVNAPLSFHIQNFLQLFWVSNPNEKDNTREVPLNSFSFSQYNSTPCTCMYVKIMGTFCLRLLPHVQLTKTWIPPIGASVVDNSITLTGWYGSSGIFSQNLWQSCNMMTGVLLCVFANPPAVLRWKIMEQGNITIWFNCLVELTPRLHNIDSDGSIFNKIIVLTLSTYQYSLLVIMAKSTNFPCIDFAIHVWE